jgi:hypothetical protein
VADNERHDEGDAADDAAVEAREDVPAPGVILVAFEKLFGGGRGVRRFAAPASAT